MIIKTSDDIENYSNILWKINLRITGDAVMIKPDLLKSVFASSPYIKDIKFDIATICRNVVKDHIFKDGNKRSALLLLELLSDLYHLTIVADDLELYEMIVRLTIEDDARKSFVTLV